MKKPKAAMGIVVAFALAAVVMAVVSVKMSPLDKTAFVVEQPYLRSSLPTSTSAAAFLVLRNETGSDGRLIAVRSALSGRVELHSHTQDANGVMRMGPIEGGVPLAKGSSHSFVRGGDHLMFTGLEAPLEQGQLVPVTLVFEKAGEIEITVPVDQER